MNARDGDAGESRPRTVADLLAQHGGGSVPSGGRRRRRATDPEDTAPQAIIDRVLSDSGRMHRLDEHGLPVSSPPPLSPAAPPVSPPTRHASPPPSAGPASPPVSPLSPSPASPPTSSPATSRPARSSSPPAPSTSASSVPTAAATSAPTSAPPSVPRKQPPRMLPAQPPATRSRRDEEPTETIPRIDADVLNPPATGPYPASPRRPEPPQRGRYQPEPDERGWDDDEWDDRLQRTEQHPTVARPGAKEVAKPDTARPAAASAAAVPSRVQRRVDEDDLVDDEPDRGFERDYDRDYGRDYDKDYDDKYDDAEYDADEGEAEESPAKEWLVMASQLAIGAIGGAALWLGFQWLWRTLPVAALVVALVVITALVWVVRRIRHSDDLQTTVVTVLVGLFVTVSPAALLLLGR